MCEISLHHTAQPQNVVLNQLKFLRHAFFHVVLFLYLHHVGYPLKTLSSVSLYFNSETTIIS